MKYGSKPKDLGVIEIDCPEMLFYQYLPIKLIGQTEPIIEERLKCFEPLIGACCCDFVADYGLSRYMDSFVYLTVKRLYQGKGYSFNRKGYHSDGFLTDDINYLWSNSLPTVFNFGKFDLSLDDDTSMAEMEQQAKKENEFTYPQGSLLRLDQFVIHKVSDKEIEGMRTFAKVSFSKDKYDLKGNAKNYLLDYDWEMRERQNKRNIPQEIAP
jgi:hypothetical protein